MDQELYDLVYLLDQLARAAGAYDGSPLQARVRRALNAVEEERYGGKLVQVVPGDGLRIGDPVTKLPVENDVPYECRYVPRDEIEAMKRGCKPKETTP